MRILAQVGLLLALVGGLLVAWVGSTRAQGPSNAVWVAFAIDTAVYIITPDGGLLREMPFTDPTGTANAAARLHWLDHDTLGVSFLGALPQLLQADIGSASAQGLPPAASPHWWPVIPYEDFDPISSPEVANLHLSDDVGVNPSIVYDPATGLRQPVVYGTRSPDGAQFVFLCVPPFRRQSLISEFGLCVADYRTHTAPGSTNPRWLARGYSLSPEAPPQWSDDGRWVIFAATSVAYLDGNTVNQPDLFRVEVMTGEVQRLTDFSQAETGPQYSPDDGWIVFSGHLSNDTNLYRIRASGTRLRQMTSNAAYDRFPQYAPTGDYVVFVSDRTGFYELYRVPTEGFEQDVERITRLERDIISAPALSPPVEADTQPLLLVGGAVLLALGAGAVAASPRSR